MKCGGKKLRLPPRGAFVVVVVVVADKEYGTPTRSLRSRASPKALGEAKYRRGWRRQGFRCVMVNDVMPDSMYAVPTEVAGGCRLVRGRWQGWRHWRQ
ncbi:MAG: hypothetical protein JNJ78_11680 [Anaerolineae bacterium]|nr:hypothetical protein [Anaerolineae bacterium]